MAKFSIFYIEGDKNNIRRFRQAVVGRQVVLEKNINYQIIASKEDLETLLQQNTAYHYIIGDIVNEKSLECFAVEQLIEVVKEKDPNGKIVLHSPNEQMSEVAKRKNVEFEKRYCGSTGNLIKKIIESNEPTLSL